MGGNNLFSKMKGRQKKKGLNYSKEDTGEAFKNKQINQKTNKKKDRKALEIILDWIGHGVSSNGVLKTQVKHLSGNTLV